MDFLSIYFIITNTSYPFECILNMFRLNFLCSFLLNYSRNPSMFLNHGRFELRMNIIFKKTQNNIIFQKTLNNIVLLRTVLSLFQFFERNNIYFQNTIYNKIALLAVVQVEFFLQKAGAQISAAKDSQLNLRNAKKQV